MNECLVLAFGQPRIAVGQAFGELKSSQDKKLKRNELLEKCSMGNFQPHNIQIRRSYSSFFEVLLTIRSEYGIGSRNTILRFDTEEEIHTGAYDSQSKEGDQVTEENNARERAEALATEIEDLEAKKKQYAEAEDFENAGMMKQYIAEKQCERERAVREAERYEEQLKMVKERQAVESVTTNPRVVSAGGVSDAEMKAMREHLGEIQKVMVEMSGRAEGLQQYMIDLGEAFKTSVQQLTSAVAENREQHQALMNFLTPLFVNLPPESILPQKRLTSSTMPTPGSAAGNHKGEDAESTPKCHRVDEFVPVEESSASHGPSPVAPTVCGEHESGEAEVSGTQEDQSENEEDEDTP